MMPTVEQLTKWLEEHIRENVFTDRDNAEPVVFHRFLAEALLKFIKGND